MRYGVMKVGLKSYFGVVLFVYLSGADKTVVGW